MTISLRVAGTVTASGTVVTALNPAVGAGATTGDLSVLSVTMKPYSTTINTPSGWTKISEYTNGTVVNSADLGSTKIAVFVKESAAVGAIGNLTWGTTPTSALAVINTYAKTGAVWDYSAFQVGIDNTNGTNYSATGIGGLGVEAGDWIVASTAVNNDLGVTGAMVIAFTGATLGTATNRTVATTTTGDDSALYVRDVNVTARTTSIGPPVLSYTSTTSGSGTTLLLRLRETTAPAGPVLAQQQMVKLDTSTTTSLVSAPFSVVAGDVLVVKTATESNGTPLAGTPTASGNTFTQQAIVSASNNCGLRIFTAIAAASGDLVITAPFSGTVGWHSMVVERWTNATLAGTPATNGTTTGSGIGPSTTMTTTGANSCVTWVSGDWAAVAQGTIALRSSAVLEGTTGGNAANYTAYFAKQDAPTAGSQTIGMTTPATAQTWAMIGIEILTAKPLAAYGFPSSGASIGVGATITDDSGNGNTLTVATGAMGLATGVTGQAAVGNGTTHAATSSTTAVKPVNAMTLMGWIKVTGTTGYGQAFGRCNDDTGWGDAFSFYRINSNVFPAFTVDNAGASNENDSSWVPAIHTPTANTWTHYALTWDSVTDVLSVYVNGTLFASKTKTGTAIYYGSGGNTTRFFNVFRNEQFTEKAGNTQVDEIRVFNTALGPGQIMAWKDTPIGVTSTPLDLDGSIQSTSTTTGNETLTQVVVGSVASTSLVTGALAQGYPITGGVSSTSSVTGNQRMTSPLAGSVASSSSVTGTMTVKQALTGSVASVSTVVGSLIATGILTGSIASSSSTTGVMVARLALTGSSNSTSSVISALGMTTILTGSIASSSTVSGVETMIGVFTGSVISTSRTVADFTGGTNLSGSIVSTSTVTGALIARQALVGSSIVSTSTIAGALRITFTIAGSVSSVSTVTGSIVAQRVLTGSAISTSSVIGALRQTHIISGVVSSTSVVTASFTGGNSLAGTIQSTSLVTGVEGLTYTLGGSVASTSTVAGVLARVQILTGSVASTSVVTGQIRSTQAVIGSIISTSLVTADLRQTMSLAGSVQSTSVVMGSIAVLLSNIGSVISISTVTGIASLQLVRDLNFTIGNVEIHRFTVGLVERTIFDIGQSQDIRFNVGSANSTYFVPGDAEHELFSVGGGTR